MQTSYTAVGLFVRSCYWSVCHHSLFVCLSLHRALLKEDWEEAVNLIIAGNNSENLPFRQIWLDTKDVQKTLEALDSRHYIERVVLRSLLRRPTDFFGAVKCVSISVCVCVYVCMCVHGCVCV